MSISLYSSPIDYSVSNGRAPRLCITLGMPNGTDILSPCLGGFEFARPTSHNLNENLGLSGIMVWHFQRSRRNIRERSYFTKGVTRGRGRSGHIRGAIWRRRTSPKLPASRKAGAVLIARPFRGYLEMEGHPATFPFLPRRRRASPL